MIFGFIFQGIYAQNYIPKTSDSVTTNIELIIKILNIVKFDESRLADVYQSLLVICNENNYVIPPLAEMIMYNSNHSFNENKVDQILNILRNSKDKAQIILGVLFAISNIDGDN
jgi:hypothetical protein